MKTLTAIFFLSVLTACSNEKQHTGDIDNLDSVQTISETTSTKKVVLTGNDLIDSINEIKNIPYRTLSFDRPENDPIHWNCGDSLYWKIVQLGEKAIPYLITKTQDSSKTDIQIPCRKNNLTVGTIAFIALDEIVSIPYSLVFEFQWDVFELNCDFGYSTGLLEYMNNHPQETNDKLMKWYDKYGGTIKKEKLNSADQSYCQKEYGIDYRLTIRY